MTSKSGRAGQVIEFKLLVYSVCYVLSIEGEETVSSRDNSFILRHRFWLQTLLAYIAIPGLARMKTRLHHRTVRQSSADASSTEKPRGMFNPTAFPCQYVFLRG